MGDEVKSHREQLHEWLHDAVLVFFETQDDLFEIGRSKPDSYGESVAIKKSSAAHEARLAETICEMKILAKQLLELKDKG